MITAIIITSAILFVVAFFSFAVASSSAIDVIKTKYPALYHASGIEAEGMSYLGRKVGTAWDQFALSAAGKEAMDNDPDLSALLKWVRVCRWLQVLAGTVAAGSMILSIGLNL